MINGLNNKYLILNTKILQKNAKKYETRFFKHRRTK